MRTNKEHTESPQTRISPSHHVSVQPERRAVICVSSMPNQWQTIKPKFCVCYRRPSSLALPCHEPSKATIRAVPPPLVGRGLMASWSQHGMRSHNTGVGVFPTDIIQHSFESKRLIIFKTAAGKRGTFTALYLVISPSSR